MNDLREREKELQCIYRVHEALKDEEAPHRFVFFAHSAFAILLSSLNRQLKPKLEAQNPSSDHCRLLSSYCLLSRKVKAILLFTSTYEFA